jgi:hypothetical protein
LIELCLPPPEPKKGPFNKKSKFDILDEDGIASPGLPITLGDVYINKQTPTNTRDHLVNIENMPDTGNDQIHIIRQIHISIFPNSGNISTNKFTLNFLPPIVKNF